MRIASLAVIATLSLDGAVVEIEEQVAFDSLPAAVKEGLRAKAGTGKLLKVESLTKRGKLVAYEAVRKKKSRSGPTANHWLTKSNESGVFPLRPLQV
jgi:hypothetical protein